MAAPMEAAERPGIGLYAETGLHASLKARYAARGGRVEASVEGRVVDVALPDELVEIQTRNLGSIVGKVLSLACVMPVRVVLPIRVQTTIDRLDPATGTVSSSRRSGARRDLYSAFDELLYAPLLVGSPNVRFDLVLVRVRETRLNDGGGSWRRRGDRILARELDEVLSTVSLDTREDWLGLIPADLPEPWDSAALGAALGIAPWRARRVLYTLCRARLLREDEKNGRRKSYRREDR